MLERGKEYITKLFNRRSKDGNEQIAKRQKLVIKLGLIMLALIIISLVMLIQEKAQVVGNKKNPERKTKETKLLDSAIDAEKRWRDHFEAIISDQNKEVSERLKEMEEKQEQLIRKIKATAAQDLKTTKEKLALAQAELMDASLELKKVVNSEQERMQAVPGHRESQVSMQNFEHEVEYDQPKSAANYIPEGTYFTGNLLGGIVVSTALNAPDEHATPVSIQLKGRFDIKGRKLTNLSPLNKLNSNRCRIMGSAYGDLSSERAIIRLEKLVCENNGLYQVSKIAGQIFGPDGYNGIKGIVISTSSKHIKNAAIGGMISGLSGATKGQDGASITGAGLITTQKKGAGEIFTQGAMQGVSNAGEKIADYYLKQAEAMSPVLAIDPGVRVNAQITKGFFLGETGTHKKIKQAKR